MAVIECQHCGAMVTVADDANVRTGHDVSSAKPHREWVIRDRGVEIHRCTGAVSDTARKAVS